MSVYNDKWITVDSSGITVRFYYFPFGSKRIPYEAIGSVSRVNMGVLTGKARVWGTANLGYWASLDPARPKKQIAFLIDNGKPVKPFLTPEDPQAFEAALSSHGQVAAEHGGRSVLI